MALYTTDHKVLLSEPFTLLVGLVLLWTDYIFQVFLFVMHHQETLLTG
jgi:hypothetical protein